MIPEIHFYFWWWITTIWSRKQHEKHHQYNMTQQKTTRGNTSKIHHNTNTTRVQERSGSKKRGKLSVFFIQLHTFLISLRNGEHSSTCNFVLNLFNTKEVYMSPSDMLLSNQGRITSCPKLSSQTDIKLKITIQVPKTYI